MPIIQSAKKALKSSKRRKVFNLRRKSAVDKHLKAFRKAVIAKDNSGAKAMIPILYKALDKASKTGYIKDNTASRLKSRAMASLNKLG